MSSRHISEESERKLLGLEASNEQGRDIVRHLLTGCPDCLAMVYRITTEMGLWPEGGPLFWENAYEKIFNRALAFANEEELRLALDHLRGWAKWAGLEPMTPQRRLRTVESDPSYHTWGVYERLLEGGRGYLHSEPMEAADVIHLALKVGKTRSQGGRRETRRRPPSCRLGRPGERQKAGLRPGRFAPGLQRSLAPPQRGHRGPRRRSQPH